MAYRPKREQRQDEEIALPVTTLSPEAEEEGEP